MSDSTIEPIQFKTCSNPDCPCENPQPIENFSWRNKDKGTRLAYCRMCVNTYQRNWRLKNPTKSRAYDARYRQNHPEDRKAAVSRWREKNPERHRENKRRWARENRHHTRVWETRWANNNRDRLNKRARKWKLKNPTADARRRARKLGIPDAFTAADWQHALDYFKGCCAYCGRPAGLWHVIAQDHFIPIASSSCPGSLPTNMLPACHTLKDGRGGCNNAKSDKSPQEWLIDKFGPRKAKQILKRIQEYFDSLD